MHGVLHRLTLPDFARLSESEGGYAIAEVQVAAYDGRTIAAQVGLSNI